MSKNFSFVLFILAALIVFYLFMGWSVQSLIFAYWAVNTVKCWNDWRG